MKHTCRASVVIAALLCAADPASARWDVTDRHYCALQDSEGAMWFGTDSLFGGCLERGWSPSRT